MFVAGVRGQSFLLLSFLIFTTFSCTQSDVPSPPLDISQVSKSPLVPSSQLLQAEDQRSPQDRNHPNTPSGTVLSDIDFMQADTDGDKVLDGMEICQDSKVCITRGRTNEQIVYSHPTWTRVRILDSQDTDGKDGEEIILEVFDDEGGLVCICVINDANRLIGTYRDSGWHSVHVHAVVDTDGLAGKEIVFLAKDARGAMRCVCVIHDQNGDVQSYRDWGWSSVKSLWSEDTDGKPGLEIVLEVQNSLDQLHCVCVIHDSTQKIITYSKPSWAEGGIILLTDTDGNSGNDIVFGYRASFGSGIDVIHDENGSIRTYTFRGEVPAIQHVGPSSRHKGNDLCVLVEKGELLILAERNEQPEPVETCDQDSHSPSVPIAHNGRQAWLSAV